MCYTGTTANPILKIIPIFGFISLCLLFYKYSYNLKQTSSKCIFLFKIKYPLYKSAIDNLCLKYLKNVLYTASFTFRKLCKFHFKVLNIFLNSRSQSLNIVVRNKVTTNDKEIFSPFSLGHL